MKRVVGVSLGASAQDFAFRARFLGRQLDVRRVGTDHSVARAEKLLRRFENGAGAMGGGGGRESHPVGSQRFVDKEGARLMAAVTRVPATTGSRLGDILQEWALRHVQSKLGSYFNNARVLFFSGVANYKLAQAFAEYTPNLEFADALLQLGVPKMLGSIEALELYASGAHVVTDRVPDVVTDNALAREWQRWVLRRAMRDATVIVAPVHELDDFGIEELAGKTILTSTVSEARIAKFRKKGVHLVIDGAPSLFGHVLGPSVLDAMIIAARGKEPEDLLEDDYLEIITGLAMEPRMIWPGGFRRVNRWAFVIHPLSQEYFKNVKPIELLSHVSPPAFMDVVEKAMAYAPPFVYSHVTGIKSPTGVEAEGWLISVGGTPKEIMSHSPEFT